MAEPPRPQKRRRLPPPTFASARPRPSDDPSQHQGRTRATPHVPGDWPSHVFVALAPEPEAARAIRRLVQSLPTDDGAEWRSLIEPQPAAEGLPPALHLSLSVPFALKAPQRPGFRASLRRALAPIPPFDLAFAALCGLVNDRGTRGFVAAEVGYGHDHMRRLTDAVDSALAELRLPPYYPDSPRFHASLAWRLLGPPGAPASAAPTAAGASSSPPASADVDRVALAANANADADADAEATPRPADDAFLPPGWLDQANDSPAARSLRSQRWRISAVTFRSGRDEWTAALQGAGHGA